MSFTETIDLDLTEVAEIRTDSVTGFRSLFSKKSFEANEVVIGFMARATYETPNYLTVQINDDVHIELFPECLECINHSCNPNCFFDTTLMELVTVKPIAAGEEFSFFYPSAEWDMDQPFACHCGSKDCIGTIQGAKHLSAKALKKYKFTGFIQQKLASR